MPRGDEAALFRAFNDDLTRSVAHAVVTSPETVDDAVAFAWAQFMRYQPDRDRNWQGWLFRVAQREAWKLDAVARETLPYEPQEVPESGVTTIHQVASPGDPQWQRMELNAATEILATLPPRIRQVAMLRATGTGYKEIAELTGNTERTVHRLVRRANESISEAVREATRSERSGPGSPRAERLESLERKPPRWLVAAIGRPPGRASATSGVLAWRRAALAIDDYRRVAGFADEHEPIGAPPTEPQAARAHAAATRAVTRLREAREHGRPFDSSR